MADLIDRQEAIVSLMREIRSYAEGPRYRDVVTGLKIAVMVIQEKVPSAQPKPDENTLSEQQESDKLGVKTGGTCTDCISRQAAIDEIKRWIGYIDEDMILRIQTGLKKLPSAQPERRYDEWCTDCKEYDQEKRCCPRFNHVIRTTLQEVQEKGKGCVMDLIDRQAAIYFKVSHGIDEDGVLYVPYGEVKKYLEQLPSAQPERKKGEWTRDNACPFCGFQPWYERDIHTLSFCPNCGADMRGEQDG